MSIQSGINLQQHGKALVTILVAVLLILVSAAAYFYFGYKPDRSYRYVNADGTELHGNINWEQSNIPLKNIMVVLYRHNEQSPQLLLEQEIKDDGYYRIQNIDAEHPVVLKVFRSDANIGKYELLAVGPLLLREGRSKYLSLYIPSQAERQAGGYPDRIEGSIKISGRNIFISPREALRIRLEGDYLDELKQFSRYRVVVKGEYKDQSKFKVRNYHILEIDNGERPLMGVLGYKMINGNKRFVLQGEVDSQLLYVPANYRLRAVMGRSIGKKVLLSGREENDGIKPLTFEVITNQ